jgi:hypothetical protein
VLGVGTHMFEDKTLESFRKAVVDEKKGSALAGIVKGLRAKKYEVGGEYYKKVPKGFDAAHPRAELLKHNAIKAVLPLHEWLLSL